MGEYVPWGLIHTRACLEDSERREGEGEYVEGGYVGSDGCICEGIQTYIRAEDVPLARAQTGGPDA